jgi:serine phosphatase RsbU (regulator of sigma subunit)
MVGKTFIFLKYLSRELINPINYLISLIIGATINAAQGHNIFFSAVPYIIPLFVQTLSKASIRYKHKDLEILCVLPGERKDPAFVMDWDGSIVASEGNTKEYFRKHKIEKIHHLFGKPEELTILEMVKKSKNNPEIEPLELYSEIAHKWYQIQIKMGADRRYILIWLDEISSRKALDASLSEIRQFSNEVINSIHELVITNNIYDRLARLIIREGYRGIFITREDQEGNLAGYVFKGMPDDSLKSDLIKISKDSSAPIWDSHRAQCDIYGCVVSTTKEEAVTQEDFEKAHPFDERVKAFLGFPITSYVNYHEEDVSIIAFDKKNGIKRPDLSVFETVVNTARSITYLIDLAIGNNKLLSALELAEEVQQNLLPKNLPTIKGLDVAAKSVYCNKTGGDYYDFLTVSEDHAGQLNVVVGDVSGHGIAAGLLMTTARAFIRSRSFQSGSLSQIVTEVNHLLTLDIYETGRFMTIFYLTIDSLNQCLRWVRAGHDAALLYSPANDCFEELYGRGMALGVDENWQYQENERSALSRGQIIFIGTDGIWETMNPQGDLFGKKAVQNIIRQKASSTANEIMDAILFALSRFREEREPEDDVTLVVIKIEEDI